MSRPHLGWYVRRLRRMSVTEVVYRAADVGRRRAWARHQVRVGATPPLPPGMRPERTFASPLPPSARAAVPAEAAAALIRAADTVLAGEWMVFGTPRADSADPDWFYDPLTGRRAPDRELAFRVHHRDEAETGNIKQVWEMSRHHQVTVLAAAWWLTQEERYAAAAAHQLRSWWRANPFLTGVHWTSGIEAGVRLISWVWTRRLLDDWPKVGDLFEHNHDALRQIAWHQEFLAAFPSRGSSANNHVVAEAAGRLVAACAFPWYAETPEWRRSGAALLERELMANTFADGLNRELATDYHRFVFELGLLAAVEADADGYELSETTWQRLARMLDAAAAIVDATGRPPRQGDGDEGRALVVDDPDHDPWSVRQPGGRPSTAASRPVWSVRSAAPVSCHDCRPDPGPSRMPDWSSCAHALRTVPKSGVAATADRTDSCRLRRMPTRTHCPSSCDTTASISSPTPARTAITANRYGGNGSARRPPTTPSRSMAKTRRSRAAPSCGSPSRGRER
jgi:Heparinase II/III N-terminus